MRPFSHSCLASRCLVSEQVTAAGKGSVWDALSDLFMQPRVSAGLWRSIKQWSYLKLTVGASEEVLPGHDGLTAMVLLAALDTRAIGTSCIRGGCVLRSDEP